MNRLIELSFISCIFLSLNSIPLGFIDFYYYYIVAIIAFPLLIWMYQKVDIWLLFGFFYLFIIGLINVFLGNNEFAQFIKVFVGTFVFFLLFYFIIKYKKFDLWYLFTLYYRFAVFHAYIGLIQFLSFLIGFKYGYDFSWFGARTMRPDEIAGFLVYPIHALVSEPAAFVIVQSAAIYFAIGRFLKSNSMKIGTYADAVVIISTFILSLSSTGYFALFISILLLFSKQINFKRIVAASIVLPGTVFLLYTSVPKFQERFNTMFLLMAGRIYVDATYGEDAAGSSLILANHFLIAKENANNHFLGTGLGSHHVAFQRYNKLETWFTGYGPHGILLNENDASSLFSRILSEMGYVGILAVLLYLFRFYIRKDSVPWTSINHASLVFILTMLLRGGHYFLLGLPFFVLSYYYSSKLSQNESVG